MDDGREKFEDIYLNLSAEPGKCRVTDAGLGWRSVEGGDPFFLDPSDMNGTQWSRAARGYELKIFTKTATVVQLDGFKEDVRVGRGALALGSPKLVVGLIGERDRIWTA